MKLLFLFLALSQLTCITPKPAPYIFQPSQTERKRAEFQAAGKNGAVATSHPLASEAGLNMLKLGGNAVDAAVAASFTISVVKPHSTGIGGGGFLLSYLSEKKQTDVYDFRERAPARATRDMYLDKNGKPKDFIFRGKRIPNASVNGHLAVATPGLVAGLLKVHEEHGSLPLKTVMAPAIDAAEKGIRVYPSLAQAIEERKDVLLTFPETKKIFFPDGRQLREGHILIQRDLAWTLRKIMNEGVNGFYKGVVANRIQEEIRSGQGILSKLDLESYSVKKRLPVQGTYLGYKVVAMPPPSSGGVHIIQMLNMLEDLEYHKLDYNGSERIHILAEVMRRAFADRATYLGDPDFTKVPTKGLIDRKYAKNLASSIDMDKATPSSQVGPGKPFDYESKSTTHLSVVDKWGNAVSTTQTINYWFGSGVVVRGTGIILNNEMDDFSIKPGQPNVFGLVGGEANAIAARKTMLSSMSPTIVFGPNGQVELVVGSPGGPRIINATLQAILNRLAFKMPLATAVHAARIHHQWLPDELRVEKAGIAQTVAKELVDMGHKITIGESIGDVQAITREKGYWIGVSDTRAEGHPLAY